MNKDNIIKLVESNGVRKIEFSHDTQTHIIDKICIAVEELQADIIACNNAVKVLSDMSMKVDTNKGLTRLDIAILKELGVTI